MANLYNVDSPINREERNNLNLTFQDIQSEIGKVVLKTQSVKDEVDGSLGGLQSQIDTLVVEGDSSPEAAQARVDANGEVFPTLKSRIDSDFNSADDRLKEITVNPYDFGVVGDGIADDTVALNSLFSHLSSNGGRVFLGGQYLINNTINVNFTSDKTIEVVGSPDMLVKCTGSSFYDAFNFQSSTDIGNVYIEGLNVDASALGTAYGTANHMEALRFFRLKNVTVKKCEIKNIYGNGIYVLRCSGSVLINDNKLYDVAGYYNSADSYGDGIYIANGINSPEISNNFIIRNVSSSNHVGRAGIVLEFDVISANVKNNTIRGYNRAIHVENTLGGHSIDNNTINGCVVFFIFSLEKGYLTTYFKNNNCSMLGFVDPGNLAFYYNLVVGNTGSGAPKLVIDNNKFNQDEQSANLVSDVSLANVVFSRNEFKSDTNITSTKRRITINAPNVAFLDNKIEGFESMYAAYNNKFIFNDNNVNINSINTDYSVLEINRNTFNPSTGNLIGKLVGLYAQGEFKGNEIYKYSADTIDNTILGDNNRTINVADNTFRKTTTESPALPTKMGNSQSDTIVSRIRNRVIDSTSGTSITTVLDFFGGWYYEGSGKVTYRNAIPSSGTWAKGDKGINSNPVAGGFGGWICVTSGTPGVWKTTTPITS